MTIKKEDILTAEGEQRVLRTEPLDIPEYGGPHLIRELTGEGREVFEEAARDEGDYAGKLRAVVAAWCVCEVDGSMKFDPHKDIHALSRQPYRILSAIYDIATKLSKTGVEQLAASEKN